MLIRRVLWNFALRNLQVSRHRSLSAGVRLDKEGFIWNYLKFLQIWIIKALCWRVLFGKFAKQFSNFAKLCNPIEPLVETIHGMIHLTAAGDPSKRSPSKMNRKVRLFEWFKNLKRWKKQFQWKAVRLVNFILFRRRIWGENRIWMLLNCLGKMFWY